MKFYVEYQRRKIGIWVSSDTVKPQSRKNLLPCVSPLLSHYYTYTTFLTPEVWPFFPQLCDTSWVFYNLTNSDTTWIWHGIPQAKGLVPQDCIHNTLDTKSTSRLLTYAFDWSANCTLAIPTISWGLINLLKQLTELRRTVYLLHTSLL